MAWPAHSPSRTTRTDGVPAAWAAVAPRRAASSRSPWSSDPARPTRPRSLARPGDRPRRARRWTTRGCATSAPPSSPRRQGQLAAVDWMFNGWGAQDWATWEQRREDRRARLRAGRGAHVRLAAWSTRAAASTSTARARCCSPRPCSSIPSATRTGRARRSRRSSTRSGHPQGDLAAARADRATTTNTARSATSTSSPRSPGPASWSPTPSPTRPTPTTSSARRTWRCCAPRPTRGPLAGSRRDPRADRPPGRPRLGRLLVHQPLPLQRRRGPVRLRRPARRERGRDLPPPFPERTVTLVDARTIFAGGGGIHCITQQQPKV